MTITADEFERSDRGGIVRWTVSLLIILALHTGLLLIITLRQLTTEPIGMPPAAVMIDLAPLPAPPLIEPSLVPPPPQVQTPPLKPPAEPLPLSEPKLPKLAPSPAPYPAVTLPAPQPPKSKPKVKRAEPPPLPQTQSAPLAPPAPPAPAATPQIPTNSSSAARASWQAQLVAWLEKYKRYPRVAQEQRQQGMVLSASRLIGRAKYWLPKSTRARVSSCWMRKCWR